MPIVRLALACCITLAAAACGDQEPVGLRVVHRLVDPSLRGPDSVTPQTLVTTARPSFPTAAGSTGRLPTATIAGDTRTVLAGHASAVVAPRVRRQPRRDGGITLQAPVPADLAGAAELVLHTQVQRVRPKRRGWRALPGSVAPIVGESEQPVVRAEIAVDAGAKIVDLHVTAYRPPGTTETEYGSVPVSLPRDAVLDVAFGVLEPARDLGAVGFEVVVCDEREHCDPVLDEVIHPAADAAGWHERRVSLASHAGDRRRLRFRTTDPTGHSLPVWANPTVLAPAVEQPVSVILLSIDTLRRDHLDLYGYERETAPFLRDFAARGTVFDGLVAEAATTDPSHMTIFTAVPALLHGVTGGLAPLTTPVTTLAEVFRAEGHRTAAFTENGPLAHHRGFGLGFDEYTENKSASLLHPSGQVDRTFGQVRTWLERHGEEAFFLFVHTFQVHAPYAPPDRYGTLFAEDGATARGRPPRGLEAARRYDREIRYVDDELARLVAWLTERALLARTLVVITSDHGEEFYEHGSIGHGTLPWEEVLRVPLVLVGPGVPAGRREGAALHHVDLMPTILALAGIAPPPGGHGRVVAPWREVAGAPAEDALFSATWSLPAGLRPPAFAVRRGGFKLVRHRDVRGNHTALYDLRSDPGERRAIDDAPTERELARLLDAWTTRLTDEARDRRIAAERATPSEAADLDPEREDKLRSLGYIE